MLTSNTFLTLRCPTPLQKDSLLMYFSSSPLHLSTLFLFLIRKITHLLRHPLLYFSLYQLYHSPIFLNCIPDFCKDIHCRYNSSGSVPGTVCSVPQCAPLLPHFITELRDVERELIYRRFIFTSTLLRTRLASQTVSYTHLTLPTKA